MKRIHMPRVNARYWTGILLASIFGTNLGDFYAHESGLGIGWGLALLTALAAAVFVVEHFENRRHELYYWLVIILIRTGATNIADYLAFRVRIPLPALTLGLIVLLCGFAWLSTLGGGGEELAQGALAKTNAGYWFAMLTAGVFGTVEGDICSHAVGQGVASILLGAVLGAVLLVGRRRSAATGVALYARLVPLYWTTVAVARTAGTSMGDRLAENHMLHIGLSLSTLITGATFVGTLVFWRVREARG